MIIEELARYIAKKLQMPFEGSSDTGAVFFGYLPETPKKAVCVYGTDMRPGGRDGTRVQIAIRSDNDGSWPINVGFRILEELDGAGDIMLTLDGAYVSRIVTERGFEFGGIDTDGRQLYTADLLIYYCE